jgi:ribosomal protein S18 acetylase RimI-like enzyme
VDFESIANNLRESFRVIAQSRAGEVRDLHGVSIASAGVAFEMFNAAFLSGPVLSERELAQRINLAAVHFQSRGLEWAYWVCEDWLATSARRRYRRIFEEHGLRHAVDLPGMAAESLAPPEYELPKVEVRRVGDPATQDAFCAIGSICFNVPAPWFREVFDHESVWTNFEAYVGYAGGEPVATAATVTGAGAIGVYNVGTTPDRRRQGFAEAVMREALCCARAASGIEYSVLQSTPAGLRLYERMGYRAITKFSVFAV